MFPSVGGLDAGLVGGALFAAVVFVIIDRSDAIVDAIFESDDPLTDFDADLSGSGDGEGADEPSDPFDDV